MFFASRRAPSVPSDRLGPAWGMERYRGKHRLRHRQRVGCAVVAINTLRVCAGHLAYFRVVSRD
jgi:hypothetical protein